MTPTRLLRPAVAGLCAVLVGSLARTPALADPPVRKVVVTGTATIKVVPDEMNWAVQVSINDPTLAKAKARHDASLEAALSYLKSLGTDVKDLQTGGIRFDENRWGDDGQAKKNPFSCSTQFTFTLIDFDKYGPLADALARIDGLQVQSVDYASSKEEATGREALTQALLNGRDKANDLAVAANCYIDRPLEILEGTPDIGPRPVIMMSRMAPNSGGTPAAVPGQLEISATVTVTYDLIHK